MFLKEERTLIDNIPLEFKINHKQINIFLPCIFLSSFGILRKQHLRNQTPVVYIYILDWFVCESVYHRILVPLKRLHKWHMCFLVVYIAVISSCMCRQEGFDKSNMSRMMLEIKDRINRFWLQISNTLFMQVFNIWQNEAFL